MSQPHTSGRGQSRRQVRGRNDPGRSSIESAVTSPHTATNTFPNAANEQQIVSIMSATFNGTTSQQLLPPPTANTEIVMYETPRPDRHTQTLTWKIQGYQEQEDEYKTIRKRVKHIAPGLFTPGEEADFFPQNAREWVEFKWFLFGAGALELEENAEKTRAMIEALYTIPKNRREIKSVFDKDGKELDDSLGPVLAQRTVFSMEYVESGKADEMAWPSQAELLEYGDNRENRNVGTRCGRFFPLPRVVGRPGGSFLENQIVQPTPMDRAGPIFDTGPTPAELEKANVEIDNDAEFGEGARKLLDQGLLKEIGLAAWAQSMAEMSTF